MSTQAIDMIRIGTLSLRMQGVAPEVAQKAVAGLEAELLRRWSVRGIDALALRDQSPSLRLPLNAQATIDAETLRAAIAEGLVSALSPRPRASGTEEGD